ncbi:ABC transporter permease [Anaerotalea alkaliphila]|uniref:ABC transporter permease n=1 Tax=Anaerotalea alkaliphila TaxID=2662126 RepID=A0A7X5KNE3_9FIRM|nr:ABC transporter permease [Anaerotalea alkaliphila]NDL66677.1 ABC transporter permease [Anaerotalea alkaliphila]
MAEKKHSRRRSMRGILATISPVYLWMVLFMVVPLGLILLISFLQRGVYGDVKFHFTLENYRALADPLYVQVFLTSVGIALGTTVSCLLLGYPFAYFVAGTEKKHHRLLLVLIIIPFWTNSLVRTYAWILLLRTEGLINTVLLQLGWIQEPLQMLYSYGAIFLGMTYTLFPFMILPLYSIIEKLDKSLLEASADLGATPLQTFLQVTLPLTLPGIVAGSLLVFIPSLGYFFIPDLMGGGKHMIIGNLIKNQFLASRNWPFGSAISIILILLTLLVVLAYLKLLGGDKDDMGVM